MESVKYSRLVAFFKAANAYIEANQGERSTMTFALNKLIMFYRKKIENIQKEWQDEANDELEEIRVKYCEKDKDTGVFKEKIYEEKHGEGKDLVIRQVSSKVFTAENDRKASKEIVAKSRELEAKWNDYEVTTKTHIVPVPTTLDINWIEVFNDFIFIPLSDEELEQHYLAQGKKEEKKLPELIPE